MRKNVKSSIYIGLCVFLEVCALILVCTSEAKLTFMAMAVAIPAVFILLAYMFSDYEKCLLSILFIIPILPLGGYISLRLGLLKLQPLFYGLFYIVSILALFKTGLLKRLQRDKVLVRDKYIRIALAILLVINIIFAYNKLLSLMIISLSFIPFGLLFYIISKSYFADRKKFYNKILVAISLGAIVSSLPDLLYFLVSLMQGKDQRLFGPLGSNTIITYNLLFFTLVVAKWIKEKKWLNMWLPLVIGFMATIASQVSRGAFISIVVMFILFLIFDIKNILKYCCIFIVLCVCMYHNVSNRPDVVADSSISQLQTIVEENIIPNKEHDLSKDEGYISELLLKIIDKQSKNRQILWKTGIELTQDYKLTGVGIGNFKYFFQPYSGSKRTYIDAHNILLNLSCELGIPFLVLALALMISIGISMLINVFKSRNPALRNSSLALGILLVVFFVYGNLTGISLQLTGEIYSFTATFAILFVLFYRDNIELY